MDNQDFKKLAQLARLQIVEGEQEALKNSLNEILNFVEHLNTADIEDIEPLSHPLDMYQRMRLDIVDEVDESARLQKIAPESHDNFYIVPKVLD
ncbi:MAG: Asp-tRNA(Asn)/Glu-tRNA(Gln) amidotransferase subunit GatC [Chromatiales bacterium]|nr:Asp-tRNA(Asn)/Glu-tRNA(Gln) amidotransferase subunit GatC [Chromatiales bacterium]